MMNVLILGATGQISRLLTKNLLNDTDAYLTLFGHNVSSRLELEDGSRQKLINGDIADKNSLLEALQNQDIVFLNSPQADLMNVVREAMDHAGVRRLIISGTIGLYDEVGGKFGEWGKSMMGSFSGRTDETDAIAKLDSDSNIDYTYIRMTMLYNNSKKTNYTLVPFGTKVTGAQVSREAVARFITDMVKEPKFERNSNVAIIEKGSENMSKPSFY